MGVVSGISNVERQMSPWQPILSLDCEKVVVNCHLQVADFGLAHAAESGATMFEPVFTEVRGTPGNVEPTHFLN